MYSSLWAEMLDDRKFCFPKPKYPIGGDQPKVSSGSPTYPLDVSAALTPDRRYLTVAVVNATERAQPLELNLSGKTLAGQRRSGRSRRQTWTLPTMWASRPRGS